MLRQSKMFAKSLVIWVILFAMTSPSIAEDNVKLNVSSSKKLIADFNSCKDTSIVSTQKINILSAIVEAEKTRADNLYLQGELCEENLFIIETQADEWEIEYTKCVEDSIDCGELPWWKFDLKSVSLGSILTVVGYIVIAL